MHAGRITILIVGSLVAMFFWQAPARAEEPKGERKYLLERGDAATKETLDQKEAGGKKPFLQPRFAPGKLMLEAGRLLHPMLFDPRLQPIVTNNTPVPGKDILLSSANNLYVGVTTNDLDGFT